MTAIPLRIGPNAWIDDRCGHVYFNKTEPGRTEFKNLICSSGDLPLAKVLFLHGLDAQPGGVKPTFLVSRGHDVSNPALPREDFDESVRIAQEALHTAPPDIVVGSSRGGAVAMAMKKEGLPLVLLAPAWRFFLDQPTLVGPVHIIHSPADSLISIDDSRDLLRLFPDHVTLFESGDRHTLTDSASLNQLDASVRQLAAGIH